MFLAWIDVIYNQELSRLYNCSWSPLHGSNPRNSDFVYEKTNAHALNIETTLFALENMEHAVNDYFADSESTLLLLDASSHRSERVKLAAFRVLRHVDDVDRHLWTVLRSSRSLTAKAAMLQVVGGRNRSAGFTANLTAEAQYFLKSSSENGNFSDCKHMCFLTCVATRKSVISQVQWGIVSTKTENLCLSDCEHSCLYLTTYKKSLGMALMAYEELGHNLNYFLREDQSSSRRVLTSSVLISLLLELPPYGWTGTYGVDDLNVQISISSANKAYLTIGLFDGDYGVSIKNSANANLNVWALQTSLFDAEAQFDAGGAYSVKIPGGLGTKDLSMLVNPVEYLEYIANEFEAMVNSADCCLTDLSNIKDSILDIQQKISELLPDLEAPLIRDADSVINESTYFMQRLSSLEAFSENVGALISDAVSGQDFFKNLYDGASDLFSCVTNLTDARVFEFVYSVEDVVTKSRNSLHILKDSFTRLNTLFSEIVENSGNLPLVRGLGSRFESMLEPNSTGATCRKAKWAQDRRDLLSSFRILVQSLPATISFIDTQFSSSTFLPITSFLDSAFGLQDMLGAAPEESITTFIQQLSAANGIFLNMTAGLEGYDRSIDDLLFALEFNKSAISIKREKFLTLTKAILKYPNFVLRNVGWMDDLATDLGGLLSDAKSILEQIGNNAVLSQLEDLRGLLSSFQQATSPMQTFLRQFDEDLNDIASSKLEQMLNASQRINKSSDLMQDLLKNLPWAYAATSIKTKCSRLYADINGSEYKLEKSLKIMESSLLFADSFPNITRLANSAALPFTKLDDLLTKLRSAFNAAEQILVSLEKALSSGSPFANEIRKAIESAQNFSRSSVLKLENAIFYVQSKGADILLNIHKYLDFGNWFNSVEKCLRAADKSPISDCLLNVSFRKWNVVSFCENTSVIDKYQFFLQDSAIGKRLNSYLDEAAKIFVKGIGKLAPFRSMLSKVLKVSSKLSTFESIFSQMYESLDTGQTSVVEQWMDVNSSVLQQVAEQLLYSKTSRALILGNFTDDLARVSSIIQKESEESQIDALKALQGSLAKFGKLLDSVVQISQDCRTKLQPYFLKLSAPLNKLRLAALNVQAIISAFRGIGGSRLTLSTAISCLALGNLNTDNVFVDSAMEKIAECALATNYSQYLFGPLKAGIDELAAQARSLMQYDNPVVSSLVAVLAQADSPYIVTSGQTLDQVLQHLSLQQLEKLTATICLLSDLTDCLVSSFENAKDISSNISSFYDQYLAHFSGDRKRFLQNLDLSRIIIGSMTAESFSFDDVSRLCGLISESAVKLLGGNATQFDSLCNAFDSKISRNSATNASDVKMADFLTSMTEFNSSFFGENPFEPIFIEIMALYGPSTEDINNSNSRTGELLESLGGLLKNFSGFASDLGLLSGIRNALQHLHALHTKNLTLHIFAAGYDKYKSDYSL